MSVIIGRQVSPGGVGARGQANITDGKTRKCAGETRTVGSRSGRPDGRADNSYGASDVARGHAGSVSQEPHRRKGFIAGTRDDVYDLKNLYTLDATMRTNIDIDEQLLEEAKKIAGVSTKKAAVEAALEKFVRLHRQREALDALWGIGWEGNLDEMREGRDFGEIK